MLPESSVSLVQTEHCGSPRMSVLCYFFCLMCSANPARFLIHTRVLSLFSVYDRMRSEVRSEAI